MVWCGVVRGGEEVRSEGRMACAIENENPPSGSGGKKISKCQTSKKYSRRGKSERDGSNQISTFGRALN